MYMYLLFQYLNTAHLDFKIQKDYKIEVLYVDILTCCISVNFFLCVLFKQNKINLLDGDIIRYLILLILSLLYIKARMQPKLRKPPYSVRFSCEELNLAALRNGGISVSTMLTYCNNQCVEKVVG